MSETVAIVLSTYNNADIIEENLLSYLVQAQYDEGKFVYEQSNYTVHICIADDGSTDGTVEILHRLANKMNQIHLVTLPHGERGIARKKAMELARTLEPEYIVIMDSDMRMKTTLIEGCLKDFRKNPHVGALVIPEIAYSKYTNFMSRVKVFERNCLNNLGTEMGSNSIEAARFWRMEAYNDSGGINEQQIAFEETQPTIRYIEKGGIIKRANYTGVWHDEKEVTLAAILNKKRYYFSKMNQTIDTEERGFMKALQRWYFFRPVLYTPDNLKQYMKHPLLALGMCFMYVCLTAVCVWEVLSAKGRTT